jgi:hypothetical protein
MSPLATALRPLTTLMNLAARRALSCQELITHRAPAAQAAHLFRLIDERPRSVLQAVLHVRDAR